jgi:hypothetical protein
MPQGYVALEHIFITLALLKIGNPNSLILNDLGSSATEGKGNSGWHEEVTVKFLKV